MSTRTEICQIRGRVSQDLRYWAKLLSKGRTPGERLMKIQTTSRPDHIWPHALTRIGKAAQRRKKQEKWIEKLLFHAKDRIPEHAYGKPMFRSNKRRSVWRKTHLYWYCRWKIEFGVVLQLGTRIRSNEKIWKKAPRLFFFLRLAHAVSSSDIAYLWDKNLRVTLKPGEYQILSSENLGRKKYKIRMVFCPACLGKPRSTNKRSFISSNIDSKCEGDNGNGMKGSHKEGTQKR